MHQSALVDTEFATEPVIVVLVAMVTLVQFIVDLAVKRLRDR